MERKRILLLDVTIENAFTFNPGIAQRYDRKVSRPIKVKPVMPERIAPDRPLRVKVVVASVMRPRAE